MQPFELARVRPPTLLAVSVVCAGLAAILVLWLLARLGERLLDRPRVPRPGTTHAVFVLLATVLIVIGGTAWGTNRLLLDHVRVSAPLRIGHLRCAPVAGGQVQATFLPEPAAGRPAVALPVTPASVLEAGTTCRVQADFVTMRWGPARVAGPWLTRAAAIGQQARPRIAHAAWWPHADRLPMSLLVRAVSHIEVSAPADPNVFWSVMVLPPTGEGAAAVPAVLGLQRAGTTP